VRRIRTPDAVEYKTDDPDYTLKQPKPEPEPEPEECGVQVVEGEWD
jgi:hypothetical protein